MTDIAGGLNLLQYTATHERTVNNTKLYIYIIYIENTLACDNTFFSSNLKD